MVCKGSSRCSLLYELFSAGGGRSSEPQQEQGGGAINYSAQIVLLLMNVCPDFFHPVEVPDLTGVFFPAQAAWPPPPPLVLLLLLLLAGGEAGGEGRGFATEMEAGPWSL